MICHYQELNIIAKQCLSEDTLIYVLNKEKNHFVAKPLSELAEIGSFNVLSLNPKTLMSETKPALLYPSGTKPIMRITTESGKVVEASKGHKLYILQRGKLIKRPIDTLKAGDELVCLQE